MGIRKEVEETPSFWMERDDIEDFSSETMEQKREQWI
jgi:hypothetical protein